MHENEPLTFLEYLTLPWSELFLRRGYDFALHGKIIEVSTRPAEEVVGFYEAYANYE